jgi:hypothetical protein
LTHRTAEQFPSLTYNQLKTWDLFNDPPLVCNFFRHGLRRNISFTLPDDLHPTDCSFRAVEYKALQKLWLTKYPSGAPSITAGRDVSIFPVGSGPNSADTTSTRRGDLVMALDGTQVAVICGPRTRSADRSSKSMTSHSRSAEQASSTGLLNSSDVDVVYKLAQRTRLAMYKSFTFNGL